ncbi:MAG: TonB-dependent receptor [Flavobacteriales bacterium]|nr:TonB-dependent receptor [Flavobacteriales bacterium]
MMKMTTTILFVLLVTISFAQNGSIKGRVFDPINNEGVPFANVVIQGTATGAVTDFDGNYAIENLEPGLYNVEASSVGYETKVEYEIQTFNNKPAFVNIELSPASELLEAVEIVASPFSKREEAPVSMRTIGVSEIERNPGGNRDISRVIQSLPGVASPPSFRNDIIIRGGAPNENKFYLDGVEVPNINHFATQGSSGGPVGLINVNFIKEVDFYSAAFPANRGNATSSIFDFTLKDGNPEKIKANITVGSSDYGLTLDGPIGEKTTYIFSIRRSYLQLLFSALKLPFLPIYNDAQFKVKTKINAKNEISLIGLGALDQFEINTGVNDGVDDPVTLERNQFILGNLVSNDQWNYTIGAAYKHFSENSFQQVVVSRNHLDNRAVKYFNNDESIEANKILDYRSQEIENKIRLEHTWRGEGWKWNVGVGYENALFTNRTYNRFVTASGEQLVADFRSELNLNKYSVFTQISKGFIADRLKFSLGVRTDVAGYNDAMENPIDQLSPRLSASYLFAPKWSLNASVGRFFQLPPYTILGYRDNANNLVNKQNGITYIQADHAVLGLEYLPFTNTKISLEGFYKVYDNYPFLTRDSVSLANLGSDFGVIGNDPAVPLSGGRAYGLEFLIQQKLTKGFYGILAATLVKSEFEDKNGDLRPSAWDNGQIVTLTAGKKFKGDWEVGARFRYLGASPYTPYDAALSSNRQTWDLRGVALLDYDRLNEERTGAVHQLDMRVDKRWFFAKWSLDLYLDIQNVYNFQAPLAPSLTVVRDDNGDPLVDPTDPTRYSTKEIQNFSGTILPSIGIIIEL